MTDGTPQVKRLNSLYSANVLYHSHIEMIPKIQPMIDSIRQDDSDFVGPSGMGVVGSVGGRSVMIRLFCCRPPAKADHLGIFVPCDNLDEACGL